MNIYSQKQRWKALLLLAAIIIGGASLWYTNRLVNRISEEEKKKVELWAQGTRELANLPDNFGEEGSTDFGDISFVFDVIKNNNTVPVILTDEKDNVLSHRNLDSLKAEKEEYVDQRLLSMKKDRPPIKIQLLNGQSNFIYYEDSLLLKQLRVYPYFQLGVIALFLLVSYLAFSTSRKAEQNQVWVGMAKETAHQLGTPLSSLMAWMEYLRMKGTDPEYITEISKDIDRLNTITERFSKIGSAPVLKEEDLIFVLNHIADYIRTRTSAKVSITVENKTGEAVMVPLNPPLFEWVIENLLKNAIDAMSGAGTIHICVTEVKNTAVIDISDSVKGMSKSIYKNIFKPGFTTKTRGWGLGLSLSKRIIEEYHNGSIFVKSSELNKGTVFRIILKDHVA